MFIDKECDCSSKIGKQNKFFFYKFFFFSRSQELDKSVLQCPMAFDNAMSKAISRHVHRVVISHLVLDNPSLLEMEIDYDPRIEAFWFVGGISTPPVIKDLQRKQRLPTEMVKLGVDRAIQYLGKPNFQLRHHLPLPEILSLTDSINPDFTVPDFKYEPRVTGLCNGRRHGTNIPGFWPGDSREFGFLSYHYCGYLAVRPETFDDMFDALKVQTVLASWGWLTSQACNQGEKLPYEKKSFDELCALCATDDCMGIRTFTSGSSEKAEKNRLMANIN